MATKHWRAEFTQGCDPLYWGKIHFPKIEFEQFSALIHVQRDRDWHPICIIKFGFANALT